MSYANTGTDSRAFVFGPGIAYFNLISYIDGTTPAASVVVPIKVDIMQEISIEFNMSLKELYGQNVFPEAVGIGEGKVNGKIKNARFNSALLGTGIFGYTSSALAGGQTLITDPPIVETGISTTVTPTVPGSGTWASDLGVFYNDTGIFLTNVASGPAAGQYSVSAGTYTFSSSDSGANVSIAFTYTVTGGETFTISQFVQGQVSVKSVQYQGRYATRRVGVYLPQVTTAKFQLPTKQHDWVMNEIDFQAYATPGGTVAKLFLPE